MKGRLATLKILILCLFCHTSKGAEMTGKLFRVDPEKRSFEILKETEYDPKTEAARSRFAGVWTAEAELRKTEEVPSFAGIKGRHARRKGASAEFNAAALEVIRRHPDILVTDLHAVVDGSPVFDNRRRQNDVHFHQKVGQEALGQTVAAGIQKALEKPMKKLPLPGETFTVEGRTAFLILPENRDTTKPTPWVWYAPTLPNLPGKEEKWMFEKFTAAGIAVAGLDVGESMGNPQGRAWFTAFYNELVSNRGMAAKPCLLARSRGGLMHYNWAAEHPDKVAAIAGIYPVCNPASWPGLAKASAAYGMTKETFAKHLADHSPVDRLAPVAKAGIPIFHLHGDNDTVVPLDENSGLLKQRHDALGGKMTLDIIPGGGHDMKAHWFQNDKLVEFVIRHLVDR